MEYLRFEYNISPADLVIDIGAHEGSFSRQIFARYGCRIIAIEPTGYIDGLENAEIIKAAASDHDGFQMFSGLSLYTSSAGPPEHKYPCIDINKLLSAHDEVALVKINIEGGEYDLLDHIIDAGSHKRIKNLQVQFHLIEGEDCEARYEALAELLSETHRLEWQYPFCWESWRRA